MSMLPPPVLIPPRWVVSGPPLAYVGPRIRRFSRCRNGYLTKTLSAKILPMPRPRRSFCVSGATLRIRQTRKCVVSGQAARNASHHHAVSSPGSSRLSPGRTVLPRKSALGSFSAQIVQMLLPSGVIIRSQRREAHVLDAIQVVSETITVNAIEANSCRWSQNGHIGLKLAESDVVEWRPQKNVSQYSSIHYVSGGARNREPVPTRRITTPCCRFSCQNSDLWAFVAVLSLVGHRTGTFSESDPLRWEDRRTDNVNKYHNISKLCFQARMAKLADAADLKSADLYRSWGFKSPSGHHRINELDRLLN
jgi:hypothetical protein